MTDAPADDVDTTHALPAKTWLDAQNLRYQLKRLGFNGDERKLIIDAVEAIGYSARIERGAHHDNKLATMSFHPLGPRARDGLPPDINLEHVAGVVDDPDCCALVHDHFATKFPVTIPALLKEFVRRFEAAHT